MMSLASLVKIKEKIACNLNCRDLISVTVNSKENSPFNYLYNYVQLKLSGHSAQLLSSYAKIL